MEMDMELVKTYSFVMFGQDSCLDTLNPSVNTNDE